MLFMLVWTPPHFLVYSVPIIDFVVLKQKVDNAGQGFGVKPRSLDRVRTYVRRRAESCVELMLCESHEHRPYLNKNWFLDICTLQMVAHFSEYYIPLKLVNIFNTSFMYTSLNMVDRLNFGQKIIYKFRLFPTVS
jgi:hypothetical protein